MMRSSAQIRKIIPRNVLDLYYGLEISSAPQFPEQLKNNPIKKRGVVHLSQLRLQTETRGCIRECCRIKQEVKQRIGEQAAKRRKKITSRTTAHHKSSHIHSDDRQYESKYSRSRTSTVKQFQQQQQLNHKLRSFIQRKKGILLPKLKQFQNQEITLQGQSDHESKHKTAMGGHKISLVTENSRQILTRSRQVLPERSHSEDKSVQVSERGGNGSYIQMTPVRGFEKKWEDKALVTGQAEDFRRSRPYYKYLENYRKSKQDGIVQKQVNTEEEDRHSFASSSFKSGTRKDSNTLFHSNKLKINPSKMTKSKLSLLQKPTLPHSEQQISSFLLKYSPLDQKFNLKALVRQSDFQVVKEEGHIYFGQISISNGKKEGKGIFLQPRGIFQGQFKNDEKVRGSEKNKIGVYCGEYQDNRRDGRGQFRWDDGQFFEGEWRKGKKDGYGVWKSPKGNFYEGGWKNDKQNGKGIYMHVGGSKYTGNFKDFLKHGHGEQHFRNNDKYTGKYSQGKPHGNGKYCWANGDIYEGQFVQGSRQGEGKLVRVDGECYEGGFFNDQKHGEGRERYKDGEYFQGEFHKGERTKGSLYSKKGMLLEQI